MPVCAHCIAMVHRLVLVRVGEQMAVGVDRGLDRGVAERMSDLDLAIAVHVVAYGLTLVTADRGFERFRLRRENRLA